MHTIMQTPHGDMRIDALQVSKQLSTSTNADAASSHDTALQPGMYQPFTVIQGCLHTA
jgi:hypothetical protein